jgi:arylsulfatase A-like enzyme
MGRPSSPLAGRVECGVIMRCATASTLLYALAACGGGPSEPPPPVVMIVLDAFTATHVTHLGYGRPTTPNLDRLAQDGVSFGQAIAPAPYTLASIPSLLTGRLPDAHGLTQKTQKFNDAETTLAERFSEAGYQCFGATANANGGPAFGMDQGFDEFHEIYLGDGPEDAQRMEYQGKAMHIPRAGEALSLLEGFIARTEQGRTGFYYLHMLEPHAPYTPPQEYLDRFARDPEYDGQFLGAPNEVLIGSMHGRYTANERDTAYVTDLYDANIAYADAVVGQMIEVLKRAGLYERAIVVVTSDHGEAMWQHGQWGHNYLLFDEQVHVPLIVRLPGADAPRGVIEDAMVSLCDLAPSLADWSGLPEVEGVDGISLAPLLAGEPAPKRRLLLRTHHVWPHLALRTADEKLIVTVDVAEGEQTWGAQCFDLAADPNERVDLIDGRRETHEAALKRLYELVHDIVERESTSNQQIGGEYELMLKQLGYAE